MLYGKPKGVGITLVSHEIIMKFVTRKYLSETYNISSNNMKAICIEKSTFHQVPKHGDNESTVSCLG